MEQPDFLARIERFMIRRRVRPATFGRRAMGDPKFVFQLRAGRDPMMRTVQRVLAFMRNGGG